MAASLFKLVGDIYVNNDEANKSIQKTDDKANKLGDTLLKGTKTVAKWGAGIAAGATTAVAGMVELASSTASAADEIDKASKRMNISTDSYQELKYAAEQCGVEIGTLEKAAKKLEGTDMNLDDAISEIMSLGTEAERSEKAAELFGDNLAYTLSPILAESGESFGDLRDRAHDLGIVMSEENVSAGVKLGDTMSDVKKAFGGLVTQLGTSLVPIVQKFCDFILDNLPLIEEIFDELAPVVSDLLETILPILLDMASSILPPILDLVKAILPILGDLAKKIIPPIANLLAQILPIVTDIVNTILPPLLDLLKPIFDAISPIVDIISTLLSIALEPLKLIITPIKLGLEGLQAVFEALVYPIQKVADMLANLEFPDIDLPQWAKKLLGLKDEDTTGTLTQVTDRGPKFNTFATTYDNSNASGLAKSIGTQKKMVTLRAGGGLIDSGEMFIARENGLPEMVGRFGNTTGVANNEQIQQGIAAGVAAAMQPIEEILMQIYQNGLNIDGEKVSKILAPSMNYQLGALKG